MLFLAIVTAILISADYIFDEKTVANLVNRYVIIWILTTVCLTIFYEISKSFLNYIGLYSCTFQSLESKSTK